MDVKEAVQVAKNYILELFEEDGRVLSVKDRTLLGNMR